MTTSPQGTGQPPLTDAAQPMLPHNRCSLRGPNGSRTPIDEPHSFSSRKGANTIYVRTCDLCGAIDWDDVHEETVKRVAIETTRLRAEVERRERQIGLHLKLAHEETKRADALAAKLAAVQALHPKTEYMDSWGNRTCEECSSPGYFQEWPCPTAVALGEDGGTER